MTTPVDTPSVFVTLSYHDADLGLRFLSALGFTEVLVVRNTDDASVVEHAQLAWPKAREGGGAGGVMLGSAERSEPSDTRPKAGVASSYLVVSDDDAVQRIHAAGVAAGGRSAMDPVAMDYGGLGGTVLDPEGNSWHIGSYPGQTEI